MPEQKSETARWAQVAATVFLGVVGLIFTVIQNNQQEQNRKDQFDLQQRDQKAQLGLQIISQRELSEIDFRQKMFEVLVAELLDTEVHIRERVTRLQLFQHNFHDIFNGRALFDGLEKEAMKLSSQEERDDIIHDLVSLAKEVTQAQELLVGAKPISIKEIIEGDSTIVNLKLDQNSHEHSEEQESSHKIKIKLIKVRARLVEVRVTINYETAEARVIQFEVSYFDAPLTDNTLLPDKHRFSITLKDTNINEHPRKATLNVFEFPADFVTTGYRPTITEVNKLLEGIQ